MWLALLQYSSYCSGLEPNTEYLWGYACRCWAADDIGGKESNRVYTKLERDKQGLR